MCNVDLWCNDGQQLCSCI